MGNECLADENSFKGAPPTLLVGESGIESSGWSSSILTRRCISLSYSASEITGSSST